MLGRLIKHEFKAVSKILGILHIALFVTTLIGMVAITLNKNQRFESFSNVTLILYVLILIAVAVAVLIYLVVRFYRNLFTDEGYLMNTLPVRPYELILSKLIVCFTWSIINGFCTIVSIFLLILSQTSMSIILKGIHEAQKAILSEFQINIAGFSFYMIIGCIISVIYMFLMFYASIAIGQTMRNHKVLFSLAAYVVLYVISQLISTAGYLPFGFMALLKADSFNVETALTPFLLLSYIISIALIIIYFFITNHIISKKLNLE